MEQKFLGQWDTNHGQCTPSIAGRPSSPETIEFGPEIIPVTRPATDHLNRPIVEARQGYRPAAPIQRFNNKSLNWPALFRHFRAVADVHGWSKEQRALQLVSYLDETAMNVAQELGDGDLYNYDVLIKLLGERFDPASRVLASRSCFHARSRRHHKDTDAFADALAELCRVGYPQSPPELRQELIEEQFVRGQSDPELKKYLWVVIRTQKERKLQTLIEVCTDFSSLVSPTHLHRPAKQTFAVHQQADSYTEEVEDQDDVFAVSDRPPWNRRSPDTSAPPSLQQMFALARRMGYEMRPIAGQPYAQRRPPGHRPPPPQTRIVDSVLLRGPVGITQEISASAAASLVIYRVVARDQTLPYRLNQRVGASNPTASLLVTATAIRETLNRSGHHPHRSIRTSSGPIVIFIHHIDLVGSITGNRYHN